MTKPQGRGDRQSGVKTISIVRPTRGLMVGVLFYVLSGSAVFLLFLAWMILAPENPLARWLDAASASDWLVGVAIAFILLPTILLKLLYPSIARRIAYGKLIIGPTGLSLETEEQMVSFRWSSADPLRVIRWGARYPGGYLDFPSFYEVWELRQGEERLRLSREVSLRKFRDLAQPLGKARDEIGVIMPRRVFKAIQRHGEFRLEDASGGTWRQSR